MAEPQFVLQSVSFDFGLATQTLRLTLPDLREFRKFVWLLLGQIVKFQWVHSQVVKFPGFFSFPNNFPMAVS